MPRSLPQNVRPAGITVQKICVSRFGCFHRLHRSEGLVVDHAPPLTSFEVFEDLLKVRKLGSSCFHLRIEPLVTAHSCLLIMLDMQL